MKGYRYDLSIERWQRRVAYFHFRQNNDAFECAVEGLVKGLMHEFGEGRWRDGPVSPIQFDGLALAYQQRQSDFFVGYGIQYLLGGREPIIVKFWFDETSRRMARATILFGMQDGEPPYSRFAWEPRFSLERAMLAIALGAKNRLQFEWEYEFTLADGKWS
jgi:hypothetical protein